MVYKCPGCGADIKFDAKRQDFHCEYCNNSYDIEKMKKLGERQKAKKSKMTTEIEGQVQYHCSECGANIIADENTVATFCLYCQNPSIGCTHVENAFTPDFVIPFNLNKEDAIKAYKEWCGKKLLVPTSFKKIKQQEKMSGLYIPYTLCDIKSNFNYQVNATIVSHWKTGDYNFTKTDYYEVKRIGHIDYIKVPENGSSNINDQISYIEPFHYEDLKDFQSDYLSGFYADKFNEDKDKTYSKIKPNIISKTKQIVKGTIGVYNTKNFIDQEVRLNTEKMYYAFMPVWMLSYKYNNRVYQFMMNGQTGKITGDLPISRARSIIIFILILVLSLILLNRFQYSTYLTINIFIAIVFSILILVILVLQTKLKKRVKYSYNIDNSKITYTQKTDTLIDSRTTQQYVPPNSKSPSRTGSSSKRFNSTSRMNKSNNRKKHIGRGNKILKKH